MRKGAIAVDLEDSWKKAPRCMHGVTIYNGNNFQSCRQHAFTAANADILGMVAASKNKCREAHFICNDPAFVPKLDLSEEGFAGAMRQVIKLIASTTGQEVWQCSAFLNKIPMIDSMHFAQEGAELVATMYTYDLLESLGLSMETPLQLLQCSPSGFNLIPV